MAAKKKDYGPGEKPLRLRKRRDGTLALTGPGGVVDDPERMFPQSFTFGHAWLLDNREVVDLGDETLTLNLCNATATYRIVEHTPGGLSVELESSDLFDAPAVVEKTEA